MELDDKAHSVLIYGLWMTTCSWDHWAERLPADSHVPRWPRIGSCCDGTNSVELPPNAASQPKNQDSSGGYTSENRPKSTRRKRRGRQRVLWRRLRPPAATIREEH